MHNALQIQEILSIIFQYHWRHADLASLARTCRAFKDPALDELWKELYDMMPLACLLPGQSLTKRSSFTPAEWDNIQSYTRRIRYISNYGDKSDEASFRMLLRPPTTEPLFPNVRKIFYRCKYGFADLLYLPFPSLTVLDVGFDDSNRFKDIFESLSKFSPNIRELLLYTSCRSVDFEKHLSSFICRLHNLETVTCSEIALDTDALVHLSSMSALIKLNCMLTALSPPLNPPFTFSNLREFKSFSQFLESVLQLLSWIRLPAITEFVVVVCHCPSRKELFSFYTAIQMSGIGFTLKNLFLSNSSSGVPLDAPLLCVEDLRPLMVFGNLQRLGINLGWRVNLTDSELLMLASAWPKLQCLEINIWWGWRARGAGITPGGLAQLLEMHPSLTEIALAIDTRNYTRLPPGGLFTSLESRPPHRIYFRVLDSVIEEEAVPAVSAFFSGFAYHSGHWMTSWDDEYFMQTPEQQVYKARWEEVFVRARESVVQDS